MLTSTFPPVSGGGETYAANLAAGLTALGHEVLVATDGSYAVPNGYDDRFPFDVLRLSDIRSASSQKVAWRSVYFSITASLSAMDRPDIVHANSHECLYPASIMALHWGVPLVASLHEQNPGLEPFGSGRLALAVAHLPVSFFIAGSDFYWNALSKMGVGEGKRRFVSHGLPDVEHVDVQGVALQPSESSQNIIFCAGRIDPRKNQLLLVRALAIIVQSAPGTKLVLAGRVTDLDYEKQIWDEIEQFGLDGAVSVVDVLENDEMLRWYRQATVVVQSSTEEGLGLAVIEAMHCGAAIVVTDVVGLRETVVHGQSGIIVPPDDPRTLASEILTLLADAGGRQRLGAAAKVRARERFSIGRMAEQTACVYSEAIEATSLNEKPKPMLDSGPEML